MRKPMKLSKSKASKKCLAVKSKPLPAKTAKKLAAASTSANERIARNNQIYASSNSHASYYATK